MTDEITQSIIKGITPHLPSKFGVDFSANKPINYTNIRTTLDQINPAIEVKYGMTKLVIIHPSLDYVIKIPFNGYRSKYNKWEPFKCSQGADGTDYCLSEYELYQELKKYKLNKFVAETKFFTWINNRRVFLQEKIDTDMAIIPSEKAIEAAEVFKTEKESINLNLFANYIDSYGKRQVWRFFNYCCYYDPQILDDLHVNNYGFRANGTPCLCDFSSYFD